MRPSEIANAIKPFVLSWIKDVSGNNGASGGAGTGVAVHDFLGPYHNRPSLTAGQFLASPAAATGLPDFRSIALSDIQSVADTRYALSGRLINAGGGLTGGGALTADVTLNVGAGTGITVGADDVNVNQGFAFAWTATHTYTSPARAIGASGGWQYDDRTTAGAANRWTVYANSNSSRWMFNATDQMWLTSAGVLRSPGYVSQTTGAAVDYGTGAADFRYLYTDELHARAFIADLEQALAGAQIISKSVAMLHLAFTAPAAGASTTMTVRDLPSATGMQVFPNGDYIRVRTFARASGSLTIGDCWGTVVLDTSYGVSGYDSATKTQRYTFTRSSGADAGAMASGTVIQPDAVILDYGTTGNGIAEVNAIDGVYGQNSPYYRVATWATHPRTMTERVRMGNLRGITSVANEFGLWFGDGGVANSNRYGRFSTQAFELNNLNIQIYDAGTRVFFVDSNNHYLSLGNPAPTSWLTGTGFWVGDDSGTYKLQVGTASGGTLTEGMSWNGSALAMRMAGSSVFVDTDGMRFKLPSGSSLTYVPNSSIAWSTTPETPGTEQVYIRAARATGGIWPNNSLDLYVQDTTAGRQATLSLGASNSTSGGSAGMTFYSRGDGLDYVSLSADNFDIAAGVNVGSATGATSGQVRAHELYLGTGSDVRLYRSAADVLRTPDSLTVDGAFNLGSASGASGGSLRASGTGTFYGGIVLSGGTGSGGAAFWLWNDAASANNKIWDITADLTTLNFRVANDAFGTFTPFLQAGRSGTTITGVYFPNGPIGIGTTAPQAKLHTYDTDGGTLHNWRTTGIAGTRVTIIPNGTGDCTQSCAVMGTAYDSSGNAWELRGSLESGVSAGSEQTVQVAGDATDNLHVKVKTDGQIEIVRNAGARTWSVCLSAWWR